MKKTDEELELDLLRYVWWYDRTAAGEFVARDPEAPAWSWEAWRAQRRRPYENSVDLGAAVEESLRTGVGLFTGREGDVISVYIAKTPEKVEELWKLEDELERRSILASTRLD